MESDFDACLAFVLRWEGGYVNDPADRGGATNQGITQAVYDEWRTRKGYDRRSVKGIEPGEVSQIYLEQYWKPTRCPSLGHPMTLIMFDSAVNHGVNRAVRFLQDTVSASVDGQFGPKTMQAFDDMVQRVGVETIAQTYLARRELFYRAIVQNNPTQNKFMRGWMNRLADLRKATGLWNR